MNKILIIKLFAILCGRQAVAMALPDNNIKTLEDKCTILQNRQARIEKQMSDVQKELKQNGSQIVTLNANNNELRDSVDSLKGLISSLTNAQTADRTSFNEQIGKTNDNVRANETKLSNQTLCGLSLCAIIVLALSGVAMFFAKRIRKGDSTIDDVRKAQDSLKKAQTKMEEESVKLDNKLLEIVDKQLSANNVHIAPNDSQEQDHSLAKKVADEIVRIEMNLSRMDSSIKGYKQLSKAVERIKDNFKANGYEIIDMLGQPYNEGMKVVANFVADESLPEGKQIITGVIKPQINYNGKMIQSAQITVSQNI